MNEEAKPDVILPPIVLHGRAALEEARSRLPSSHKALLLVGRGGHYAVTASIGCANEQQLLGAVMGDGEGFLGWTAKTAEPQIRANLRYVPPGAPEPTDLEKSLEAKSAVAVPFPVMGDLAGVMAAYVCHGFNVFVLEDLDTLTGVAREWAGRLAEAMLEADSEAWLEARLPQPTPEPAAAATGDDANPPSDAPADYTAQDMEVLLSVFGVDLTAKKGQVASALKADVGELMRRDLKDLFSPKPPAPDGTSPTAQEPAEAPQEGPGAPPERDDEHYSKEDVGRVLSVFGVEVKAPDSPLSRALSADVGAILSSDVGDLIKGGSPTPRAAGPPDPWATSDPDDEEPGPSDGGGESPPADWP